LIDQKKSNLIRISAKKPIIINIFMFYFENNQQHEKNINNYKKDCCYFCDEEVGYVGAE
jgi:hypothetical protein